MSTDAQPGNHAQPHESPHHDDAPEPPPLGLFQGYGVELEYMIVDAETLDVRPIADDVLRAQAGELTSEVDVGAFSWSNELVLHVIELKTNGPASTLTGLAAGFQQQVALVQRWLDGMGARLMPTAMHPWFEPARETRLWPHDYNVVYATFDRIFGCQGHGWSNLQSTHVNLPFADDEEFGRLHAAIRLVLPLIPGLAAASPVVDGRLSPNLDERLNAYRVHSKRIPSTLGRVIPERAYTRADYEAMILEPIYRDCAPFDPEGTLRHEWVNARGAIGRWMRHAIEIRLIDNQECPAADLAVVELVAGTVRALVGERWSTFEAQAEVAEERLERVFLHGIREADDALVDDPGYLALLGCSRPGPVRLGEIWRELAQRLSLKLDAPVRDALGVILDQGPLARRLRRALPAQAPSTDMARTDLARVYGRLCDCLRDGQPFVP